MSRAIKVFLFGLLALALGYGVAFGFVWQVRDFSYQLAYDLFNENPPVREPQQVDRLLASFERVGLDALDETFKNVSKISSAEYRKLHQNAQFYLVDPKLIYRHIAGNARIKDLLSHDEFYAAAIMDRSQLLYWRIDERLLHKIVALEQALIQAGFEPFRFKVTHGYRTPAQNEAVGGAPKSRHIKGEAVDMVILDVNGDGAYSAADKQIVLDILERKVIKNEGGIGKYPGTRIVHMDVRGYRARWDSY